MFAFGRALFGLTTRFATADEVAERVGFDGIEKAGDFLLNERSHALFTTRDAGGFAQPLEEVEVFHRGQA